jgi:hypothetical protein
MPPDKNNNKSDHLIKLAVSYLRSQLQPALWTEGTKHCSQASHLVRPIQVSCLQQMAHNTKEIKKKKKRNPAVSTQAVLQEGQHPSPQSPEHKAPIPGLDTKGVSTELLPSRLKFLLLL